MEALKTPEKLNEPSTLIKPAYWFLLLGLSSFCSYVILWSIFGRIPVRITGSGVIHHPSNRVSIHSEINGRLVQYFDGNNKCFQKGQAIARIDPYELRLKKRTLQKEINHLSEIELPKMQEFNATEYRIEDEQLKLLDSELRRHQSLLNAQAISLDNFNEKLKAYKRLESSLASNRNQRKLRITKQEQGLILKKADLFSLEEKISKFSNIIAPSSGCIVSHNKHVGDLVQAGHTISELSKSNVSTPLLSYAYFPSSDGKRLLVGQDLRITPMTTKPQRHGGIVGTILSISQQSVTKQSLQQKFNDDRMVSYISNSAQSSLSKTSDGPSPLIEVVTSLSLDPDSISGYDWGGGLGPNLKISSGTTTIVKVIVEQRRPISYVIPILRDMTGIY